MGACRHVEESGDTRWSPSADDAFTCPSSVLMLWTAERPGNFRASLHRRVAGPLSPSRPGSSTGDGGSADGALDRLGEQLLALRGRVHVTGDDEPGGLRVAPGLHRGRLEGVEPAGDRRALRLGRRLDGAVEELRP